MLGLLFKYSFWIMLIPVAPCLLFIFYTHDAYIWFTLYGIWTPYVLYDVFKDFMEDLRKLKQQQTGGDNV